MCYSEESLFTKGTAAQQSWSCLTPLWRQSSRTEVSNMLHNVVSNLWTFHPAFMENTAQDILLLLWYRILNSIQSILHTANLQSNARETHVLLKIPDLCYPQMLKRKSRIPRDIFLIVKYSLYTLTTICWLRWENINDLQMALHLFTD